MLSEHKSDKSEIHEKVAREMCEYARTHILKGHTWLDVTSNDFEEIENAVYTLKGAYIKAPFDSGSSEICIEMDNEIRSFYKKIEECKKAQVGNCAELSWMAMDYLLDHYPEMKGEIFSLSGGDHVFFVLNRDPESSVRHPETWGDNAWICDPWANKYYPASKYFTELKGLKIIEKDDKFERNLAVDYDVKKHTIENRIFRDSTSYLKAGSPEHLKQLRKNYSKMVSDMESAISKLLNSLNSILHKFEIQFPEEKEAIQLFA